MKATTSLFTLTLVVAVLFLSSCSLAKRLISIQGRIVVMMEDYRNGLLWDFFMSSPEVQTGLKNLGFESPHLSK